MRFFSGPPAEDVTENFWLMYTPVWSDSSGVTVVGGFAERRGDREFMIQGARLGLGVLGQAPIAPGGPGVMSRPTDPLATDRWKDPMRILLAVEGTRGDVHPLLHLGEALQSAGHEVSFCGPPGFRNEVEARGIAFGAAGNDIHAWAAEHAAAMTRGGLAAHRVGDRLIRACIDNQFTTLPQLSRGADFVIGTGVQLGAPSAAELHGIPYRYLVLCPVLLPSREHAPFLLPWQGLPIWANRLAWRLVHALLDRRWRPLINAQRAELGLPPLVDVYRYLLSNDPVLAADEGLAPMPEGWLVDLERIPGLHPTEGPPLPEKLEAFLEAGPRPVYLGFGSMPDPDPAQTTRQMLDATERIGCRAVISEGWAGLGCVPLPESVCTIGPVSHARLFPRMAAVVHHGGAGTTTTAARAGVPQVVIPHVADQFYWARRIEQLGIGPPTLARNRLSAAPLASALAEVIENELLAERAHELGNRLRSRLSESGCPSRIARPDSRGARLC